MISRHLSQVLVFWECLHSVERQIPFIFFYWLWLIKLSHRSNFLHAIEFLKMKTAKFYPYNEQCCTKYATFLLKKQMCKTNISTDAWDFFPHGTSLRENLNMP